MRERLEDGDGLGGVVALLVELGSEERGCGLVDGQLERDGRRDLADPVLERPVARAKHLFTAQSSLRVVFALVSLPID